MKLRNNCDQVIRRAIAAVQPDAAVRRALEGNLFQDDRVVLVAVGKAAWPVARAACSCVRGRLDGSIIIAKHGHTQGSVGSLLIREAGHPISDQDTLSATEEALAFTGGLAAEDIALFLLSGGGSALFEAPLVPQEKLQSIARSLLASEADIVEMNATRKRLSAIKDGRFAQHCAPVKVFSIVLSDIVGGPPDTVTSSPTYPDSSTCADARHIVEQYSLRPPPEASQCLERETPKVLDNVETLITGSVRELYAATSAAYRELSYESVLLADSLDCEARKAGASLAVVARTHQDMNCSLAFLIGGETVVHLIGSGLGERNQELALPVVAGIAGLENTAVFSLGSDSTDGLTDVAGGFVDGGIKEWLTRQGTRVFGIPRDNDAYHALAVCGDLLHTGATGTNVNDAAMLLVRR